MLYLFIFITFYFPSFHNRDYDTTSITQSSFHLNIFDGIFFHGIPTINVIIPPVISRTTLLDRLLIRNVENRHTNSQVK